jgi:signal transduction histidine kinase
METESFRIHFEAQMPELELDTTIAKTIFLIIQEAITNAKKHAEARNIWLTLKLVGKTLYVNIRDDGKGFNVQAMHDGYDTQGSFGMLNMKERAEMIDGKLMVESRTSQPNRGTSVTLSVPIHVSDEAEARMNSQPTRPSRRPEDEM